MCATQMQKSKTEKGVQEEVVAQPIQRFFVQENNWREAEELVISFLENSPIGSVCEVYLGDACYPSYVVTSTEKKAR